MEKSHYGNRPFHRIPRLHLSERGWKTGSLGNALRGAGRRKDGHEDTKRFCRVSAQSKDLVSPIHCGPFKGYAADKVGTEAPSWKAIDITVHLDLLLYSETVFCVDAQSPMRKKSGEGGRERRKKRLPGFQPAFLFSSSPSKPSYFCGLSFPFSLLPDVFDEHRPL